MEEVLIFITFFTGCFDETLTVHVIQHDFLSDCDEGATKLVDSFIVDFDFRFHSFT